MSLDLVAVQRDAALLDALSARLWDDVPDDATDPVAGLLAALVADVDDGWPVADDGLTSADDAAVIPQQDRRQPQPAAFLTLAGPIAPVGRRHAARAVAALAVAAVVLSVGGVAAAVTGDPLTPYKNVINVVRGGYHEVVPNRSMIVPPPKAAAAAPKAKLAAAKAVRTAKDAREEVGTRASRSAWRAGEWRRYWDHRAWDRQGANRWKSHRPAWKRDWAQHRAAQRRAAERRADRRADRRQWGGSGQQSGWGAGTGGGGSADPSDSSASDGQADGSGAGRH